MSDFKLKISTEIDKTKAESQLKGLQSIADKKANMIKLNVSIGNLAKINSELSSIKNTINKAFKLDSSSINNLKQIENTLKQITKLSKENQKGIFGGSSGSSGTNKESAGVDKLLNQYKQLIVQKTTLEKQMSKTTNTQSLATLDSQLNRVKSGITNVSSALDNIGGKAKIDTSAFNNMERSLSSTFQSIQGKTEQAKKSLESLSKSKILDEKQLQDVKKLESEITRLSNLKLKDMKFMDMSKALQDIDSVKSKISSIKMPDINTKLSTQFNSVQKQADSLITKLSSMSKSGYADNAQLTRMQSQLQAIKSLDLTSMDNLSMQKSIAEVNKLEQEFKEAESTIKQLKFNDKLNIDTSKVQMDLDKLRAKCIEVGRSTADIDKLEQELLQLSSVPMDKIPNEMARIKASMSGISSSANGMSTSISTATRASSAFGNTWSRMIGSFTAFTPGFLLANSITTGIRGLKTEILDLDKAMTNVIKIADETDIDTAKKIRGITDNAIDIAKEVAGSVPDVVQSISDALKAGANSMQEATEVAKYSQIFANIGDIDVSTATTGVASLVNAFKIDPLKEFQVEIDGTVQKTTELANSMDILDYAGNNYAIGVDGLLQAMSNGGTTMAAYGVTIEETTALITSANEAVQDPAKVKFLTC